MNQCNEMNNPGPIIPSVSPPKKKNRLARFEKRIGYLNALFLKIGLWILILLSLGLLWREYHRSYYLIKPIEVPTALADAGYSAQVVSQRIFDELLELTSKTQSVRDFQGFSADQRTAAVDFQVAGFGLSVQSLATQLRMATGKTERIISGEIVNEGDQLALRLRVPGKRIKDLKISNTSYSVAVDSLVKAAAFKLFEFTEPYLHAVYLHSQQKFDQAIKACHRLVEDKEERKWGLNLIANIEKDRDNIEESIKNYKWAIEEDDEFVIAIRNLAGLYQRIDSVDLAITYLEKAMALQPKSDRIWSLANYYIMLLKANKDQEKIARVRDEVIEAGESEPGVYSLCANQSTNFGLYTESLIWSDLALKKEPRDLAGLIHTTLSNCALGNREECQKRKKVFQSYYPNNSLGLIADAMLNIMDNDTLQYYQVLDSIQQYHPDLMANADGMRIFFIMQDIYKNELPKAKEKMKELVEVEHFDFKDLHQLFFANKLMPALSDSLQLELEKVLP